MKKLLSILGVVGLTATAGATVISCGDKGGDENPTNPDQGKDEIRELIKKLESEVKSKFTSIVQTPMVSRSTLLDTEAATNGFTFFQKDNLSEIYKNASNGTTPEVTTRSDGEFPPVPFYDILTEDQQKALKGNVESLLSPTKAMANLKNSISASTYQVIIGTFGSKWIDDLTFNYANSELQYSALEGESFVSNIRLGYSSKYKYLDAENQTISKTLTGDIVVTISDDKDIVVAIDSVQTKLAGEMLKEGNEKLWVDYNDLKTYDTNLTTQDLLSASTNTYKKAVEGFNQAFAQDLTKTIKTKYFTNTESALLNAVTVSYYDSEMIRDNNNINKMGMIQIPTFDAATDWTAWNTYFGKIKADSQITLEGQRKSGDKKLYDDLLNSWTKTVDEYGKSFETDYLEKTNGIEIEQNEKVPNLLKLSVTNEQLQIKGLQFSLANGYSQRLSDISFTYSISMDNDKTATAETTDAENSSIFAAYYNGIEEMLKAFHEFYGIKESDVWLNESASSGQSRMKFLMSGATGVKTQDGKDFNIWDYWTNLEENDNPFNSKTNQEYSNAYSLESTVEARQIKEEHLISKMKGIDTFRIIQNKTKTVQAAIVSDDYTGPGGDKLSKGLTFRANGGNHNLGFGITTNLLKINFVRDQFSWVSSGTYTLIGKI
ncbi:hypothetical protein ESOMN_v1c04830 [Williamsoniiplasma somnilux]|uniref:Lipoprotein n=1 Tax=Williamsoniiplasma somnilux TaxID=215578 RepID=A0A2K8NYG3_9MOLU|nr:lipoprotein [Williamsoniiplasma somnilux]ATZ18865.1 hypothetical protein ESOMN_v1c04830 [Williamsoniiplasma somnilux]